MMKGLSVWLLGELGTLGIGAIVITAAVVLFELYAVKPLQETDRLLEEKLARAVPASSSSTRTGTRSAPRGLEAFYRFFERDETPTDWLAKFHAAATSTGLLAPTAEYKVIESGKRLERYQIAVPVTGSYAEICHFIAAVLNDVPVLSLDQVRLRRTRGSTSRVDAELVFSLYQKRG
jgi:hypothetical protein